MRRFYTAIADLMCGAAIRMQNDGTVVPLQVAPPACRPPMFVPQQYPHVVVPVVAYQAPRGYWSSPPRPQQRPQVREPEKKSKHHKKHSESECCLLV
jgi:5-methylcytosine-specific restriction endonuclease McrA